jgi:hypothetical protein
VLGLVRKRHEGDGWLVFDELANAPGFQSKRYADALALGVWASTKYEAHLYEFKISREDLKRELRDPTKAEAVGKFCTYWWLVVANEDVLRDLVVPEAWGILIPTVRGGSRILKVHRKAPRLKPAPFSPLFAMAMIRNMAKRWVSPADYKRVIAERDAALGKRNLPPPPDIAAKDDVIHGLERELKELKDGVEKFREESGVELRDRWQYGNVGRAVKVVIDHRGLATGDVGRDVALLSSTAQTLEQRAREVARAAIALRGLLAITGCVQSCRSQSSWGEGSCNCGAVPISRVERELELEPPTHHQVPEIEI